MIILFIFWKIRCKDDLIRFKIKLPITAVFFLRLRGVGYCCVAIANFIMSTRPIWGSKARTDITNWSMEPRPWVGGLDTKALIWICYGARSLRGILRIVIIHSLIQFEPLYQNMYLTGSLCNKDIPVQRIDGQAAHKPNMVR